MIVFFLTVLPKINSKQVQICTLTWIELHEFASVVKSWSRGFSWAATWWQYWLGGTPVENNHIVIQKVISGIIQSPFSLGRKMCVAKRKLPCLLQQVLVRAWIGTAIEEFHLILLGLFFIDFFWHLWLMLELKEETAGMWRHHWIRALWNLT